jgi:hypothetical protein
MAFFSSANARREEMQNIAAAERTRGARDMECSHEGPHENHAAYQPLPPLKVPTVGLVAIQTAASAVHRIDRLFRLALGIPDALAS